MLQTQLSKVNNYECIVAPIYSCVIFSSSALQPKQTAGFSQLNLASRAQPGRKKLLCRLLV